MLTDPHRLAHMPNGRCGYWLVLLFCTVFSTALPGQAPVSDAAEKDKGPSILDSLWRDDILELKLVTDFRKLIKEKKKEERLEGELFYADQDGDPVAWAVEVRTRGNQRKKLCYFPPLKIYFPKDELTARGFAKKFNDYKLVLGCRMAERYQEYVLKEYLVYQLYRQLTDISFRVQLMRIRIEDRGGKRKPLDTYGFIIENEDEMAYRLGGEILETRMLSPHVIAPECYDLMALFQFMIGNADWYAYINHNLKALRVAGNDQPVIVPYDFDYSGLVATDYATPNANYPIEDIRDRYFLGPCKEPAAYAELIEIFLAKKTALFSTVAESPYLDAETRLEIEKYLASFYTIIESPELTRQWILEHCDKHVKADK